MNTPGVRRLVRREPGVPPAAERDAAAEERRRLLATVGRLRLELARLRGELDDEAGGGEREVELVGSAPIGDVPDPVADAEAGARAGEAARRVRLLAEELAAERRARDRLEAALREEREARLTLEALRDGLEGAIEEQRRRHRREVSETREAADSRRAELSLEHLRVIEELRIEGGAARTECTALRDRLQSEGAARARAEERCRQLDREIDELRNWICAAESRRGLLRRVTRRMTPPPNL